MERAISETERRRSTQIAFNLEHGITPRSIRKSVADILEGATPGAPPNAREYARVAEEIAEYASLTPQQMMRRVKELEKQMYRHAQDLEFEQAAEIRDQIRRLQGKGLVA